MTTDAPILAVDAEARFGDFRLQARFQAGPGVTCLFGRSGAGKTTLIDVIAGLRRPDRGSIGVGGRVLFDSATKIDTPPERRNLGYVFQDGRLFPHMTVRRNLTFGLRFAGPRSRPHDFDHLVTLLALEGMLERRPATLSGGEKQRVAIGRALMAQPSLLLMDEPLSSLDVDHKSDILPLIERIRDDLDVPIVYVSHAIEEVVRLANTLVLMSDGRVAACGPLDAIMHRLDLFPLTGRFDAGAVLTVDVAAHDGPLALTRLAFGKHSLIVPRIDRPIGSSLRVRIRARDVAISLEKPAGISILNVIEGRIREIGHADGAQVDLLIDVGQPLMARITRKSVVDLGLAPGRSVFALIKAVAIDQSNFGLSGRRRRSQ